MSEQSRHILRPVGHIARSDMVDDLLVPVVKAKLPLGTFLYADVETQEYKDSTDFHNNASLAELGAWQRGWDDKCETIPEGEDVLTLALCEPEQIALHPGRLYRFVAMDGCARCQQLQRAHDAAHKAE